MRVAVWMHCSAFDFVRFESTGEETSQIAHFQADCKEAFVCVVY